MNEAVLASLDLETLSTRPDAAVIAIGVVLYIPEPFTGLPNLVEARWTIDPNQAVGHRDEATIDWWNQQDPEVRHDVWSGKSDPLFQLKGFQGFCKAHGQEEGFQWWADPAHFDFPIIENQFHMFGLEVPWTYRQKRCLMTLSRELRDAGFPDMTVPSAKHHEPVADARAQLLELLEYRKLLKAWGAQNTHG